MAKAKSEKKQLTKEVTLANSKIVNAYQQLKEFDNFKFSPITLLNLVKAGIIIKNESDAVLKTRDQIAKKFFPEGKLDEKDSKFSKYVEEVQTVVDQETTITIPIIKAEDLDLETNKISMSLLMNFDWLIELD